MNYNLRVTRQAERDIQAAADYIEFDLYNPKASDDLLDKVDQCISDLVKFPMKYRLADDPVLRSCGIRYFSIQNYIVFYVVEDQMIYIVRFLHQRREWISILSNERTDQD